MDDNLSMQGKRVLINKYSFVKPRFHNDEVYKSTIH